MMNPFIFFFKCRACTYTNFKSLPYSNKIQESTHFHLDLKKRNL